MSKDVTRDPEALRELTQVYHSRSTPTVVVNGQVMVGFDPVRLQVWLAEAGTPEQG